MTLLNAEIKVYPWVGKMSPEKAIIANPVSVHAPENPMGQRVSLARATYSLWGSKENTTLAD